jgi:hypothetical protein
MAVTPLADLGSVRGAEVLRMPDRTARLRRAGARIVEAAGHYIDERQDVGRRALGDLKVRTVRYPDR